MQNQKKPLIVVMGVSGAGKTTLGQLLAKELALPFVEADDFHPQENIRKMSNGQALTDTDRFPWLKLLNNELIAYQSKGCVMACSALKESYRHILGQDLSHTLQYVFLDGAINIIADRLQKRTHHFMPKSLLKSQFETLEPPQEAICIDVNSGPSTQLNKILKQLQ